MLHKPQLNERDDIFRERGGTTNVNPGQPSDFRNYPRTPTLTGLGGGLVRGCRPRIDYIRWRTLRTPHGDCYLVPRFETRLFMQGQSHKYVCKGPAKDVRTLRAKSFHSQRNVELGIQ
jgi:hypothetical protein